MPIGGIEAADGVGGELRGATGVDVGGILFDVEFLDGTCAELFGGCDEAADFAFQSIEAAEAASLSLLDEVFLDGVEGMFDADPALTRGCSDPAACIAVTPYDRTSLLIAEAARNAAIEGSDATLPAAFDPFSDLRFSPAFTWAAWTQKERLPTVIPEPSTALLVGLGLLGLGARPPCQRSGRCLALRAHGIGVAGGRSA